MWHDLHNNQSVFKENKIKNIQNEQMKRVALIMEYGSCTKRFWLLIVVSISSSGIARVVSWSDYSIGERRLLWTP